MDFWRLFSTPPKEGQTIFVLVNSDHEPEIKFHPRWSPLSFEGGCIGWMPSDDLLNAPMAYDPTFGDDKLCLCGHTYYRHFDSYEEMSPAGCKYCYAQPEGVSHRKESRVTPTLLSVALMALLPEDYLEDYLQNHASVCTGFKWDEGVAAAQTLVGEVRPNEDTLLKINEYALTRRWVSST